MATDCYLLFGNYFCLSHIDRLLFIVRIIMFSEEQYKYLIYCTRYPATIHVCLILSFVPTHKNINTLLTSQDLKENDIQVEPLEGSEASLLRPKPLFLVL